MFRRNMQHPVVSRMKQHGDRTRAVPSASIDWPNIRLQQTGAAQSLEDRRNSKLAERANRGCIGPFNVSDCNVSHHQRAPIRDLRSKSSGRTSKRAPVAFFRVR
jgi:hypothetical protein